MAAVTCNRHFLSEEPVQILEIHVSDSDQAVLTIPCAGKKMLKDLAKHSESPMKIVSIAGVMRLGKSFVMNELLKVPPGQHGFSLGHTYESCTKGLWAWASCEQDHILLCIDTEGLYDPARRNPDIDSKIFVLVLLLSSLVIYNVKHPIDEATIQNLRFASQMANYVKLPESSANATPSVPMPPLMFLMRDRVLQWTQNEPDAGSYLQRLLREDSTRSKAGRSVRRGMHETFSHIAAFNLPKPCSDDKLPEIEQHPEYVTPIFRDRMAELCRVITTIAQVKEVCNPGEESGQGAGTIVLTAADFLDYMEHLVIQTSEGVPDLGEAFQLIMKKMVANAVHVGEAAFEEERKRITLPMDTAELEKHFLAAGKHARKRAVAQVKGLQVAAVEEKLAVCIEKNMKSIHEENLRLSIESCSLLFEDIFKDLRSGKGELFHSEEVLSSAIEKASEVYKQLGRGPGSSKVYKDKIQGLSQTAKIRLQEIEAQKTLVEQRQVELRRQEESRRKLQELAAIQEEEKRRAENLQQQVEAERAKRQKMEERQQRLREDNMRRAEEARKRQRERAALQQQLQREEECCRREREESERKRAREREEAAERARKEAREECERRNSRDCAIL